MKRQRPAFVNHPEYIHAWMIAADAFTAARPVIDSPPAHLVERHGRPRCATCWDTGICAECLGRYPQYCPGDCDDGTCSCAAGAARREAYQASLRQFGLV